MSKITITDNIKADATSKGIGINDALAKEYEGEIKDRIEKNPALAALSPIQHAFRDAGITGNSKIRDFYTSGQSEWLFPAWVDTRLHETIKSDEVLQYLYSGSPIEIQGTSVQQMKLDMMTDEKNKNAATKKIVQEGSDLPLAVIRLAKAALTLVKRGRAVESTYESIQYARVDQFAKTLDLIARDVSAQQVGDAINTLVKGDGNDNELKIHTLAGSALVVDDLLDFGKAFYNASGLPLNVLLCGDGKFYNVLAKMTISKNDESGVLPGVSLTFPQNNLKEITVIYDSRVPKNSGKEMLIGLNKEYALEKYMAAGSNINELASNIRNQTKLGTISEIANFAKGLDSASLGLSEK